MSTRFSDDPRPVHSLEDALAALPAPDPAAPRRIGLEYERVHLAQDGAPVPYEGGRGMEALLQGFVDAGWSPFDDAGHLVGAARDGHFVGVEPGGQLEFSGAPRATLTEIAGDFAAYLWTEETLLRALSLTHWNHGVTPVALGECPWMPKARYPVLRARLEQTGGLGLRMMRQTAGVQLNLDWRSDAELARMWRVALRLAPVLDALAANSPRIDGTTERRASHRLRIWTDTDPVRCLAPDAFFSPSFSLADYAAWAWTVPAVFRARGGAFEAFGPQPFGALAATGGVNAGDWQLHLTSIFTEQRLKPHLEVRGMDSVPPHLAMVLAALWTAALYEENTLETLDRALPRYSAREWRAAYEAASVSGTAGRCPQLGVSFGDSLKSDLGALLLDGLAALPGGDEWRETARLWFRAGSVAAWAPPPDKPGLPGFPEGVPSVLRAAFEKPFAVRL